MTEKKVIISYQTIKDNIASLLYALGVVNDDEEIIDLHIEDISPKRNDVAISYKLKTRAKEEPTLLTEDDWEF